MEKKKSNDYQYFDNKEYQARFLLDPDVSQEIDYKHLDKNLAITNLAYNPRLKIDEVGEARSILRGLHVLNNPKHYNEKEEFRIVDYKEVKVDGNILRKPVYQKVKILTPKYPKIFHALKSEFISFVNSTAARKGHRINSAITNRLIKEETINDKTQVKSRFGGFGR